MYVVRVHSSQIPGYYLHCGLSRRLSKSTRTGALVLYAKYLYSTIFRLYRILIEPVGTRKLRTPYLLMHPIAPCQSKAPTSFTFHACHSLESPANSDPRRTLVYMPTKNLVHMSFGFFKNPKLAFSDPMLQSKNDRSKPDERRCHHSQVSEGVHGRAGCPDHRPEKSR